MSDDEAQPTPSPSTSTKHFLDMTTDEWMDRFAAAAIEGFPKVIERDRKAIEAHYDEVARRTGLPRAKRPED
jgi:hypothetical protein